MLHVNKLSLRWSVFELPIFLFLLLQLFDFIQQFWSKTKRTIRSHHHSLLLAVRTHRLSKFKIKYMCNFHPVILKDSFQIEHSWKGNDFLMKILLIEKCLNFNFFWNFFTVMLHFFSLFSCVLWRISTTC